MGKSGMEEVLWIAAPLAVGTAIGSAIGISAGKPIADHLLETFELSPTEGVSMEPSLHTGDRLIIRKHGWKLRYGDMAIIQHNIPSVSENICKRVIGLPGDRIILRDGKVFRNGAAIDEPYLGDVRTEARAGEKDCYFVGGQQIFVLGDNRPVSLDSRCTELGLVSVSQVVGVVVAHVPEGAFGDALLTFMAG